MTDSVEIKTTNRRLSTMMRLIKVSPSDCDNDCWPEMAIWSPKPEIFISMELWHIASKFQRQIRGFRLHRARTIFLRAICTTTDNQKWQSIDVLGVSLAIFGCWMLVVDHYWSRPAHGHLRFSTTASSKTASPVWVAIFLFQIFWDCKFGPTFISQRTNQVKSNQIHLFKQKQKSGQTRHEDADADPTKENNTTVKHRPKWTVYSHKGSKVNRF